MQPVRLHSVLRWLVVCAVVLSGLIVRPPSAAADPTVATRIADRSFPGVHMIIDVWRMTATIPVLTLNEEATAALEQQLKRQVESGTLPATEEAVTQAIIDAIEADPGTYYVGTGETRSTRAEISAVGTGWTVTPDGHVVTAAHVVDKSEEELIEGVGQNALEQFLKSDMEVFASGDRWTDGQLLQIGRSLQKVYAATMKLSNVQHVVKVRLEEPGDEGKVGREVEATIVDMGAAFPGPDWALLKVEGEENLPTIPMGDEKQMVTGADLFIVGFPMSPTFLPGATVDSVNTPTITSGSVTAVKATESEGEKVPVFQTQAPSAGGNSGGPAFNTEGEAIGILVAGSKDPETGANLDGQGWVIQTSVVKEALARNGVTPTESDTTRLYNEGLEAFYVEHFSAAKKKFDEVRKLYPGHPYAQDFIVKSQEAIDAGRDKTPPPAEETAAPEQGQGNAGREDLLWVWIALGVGSVALVAAIIALVVSSRRRRRAIMMAPGPYQPQPWRQPHGPGGQPPHGPGGPQPPRW